MVALNGANKDLYRVLKIPATATSLEIKDAYRRLAMELHPDRNDGCEKKAGDFKAVTAAYNTLSDKSKRRAYDRERDMATNLYQYGHVRYKKQTVKERTAAYRKVYTTPPPPGFKTFDHERHYYMHYGDGIMEEEIERARLRAQKAGSFNDTYESPLGKGFTIRNGSRFNQGRWKKQAGTKTDRTTGWEYQSAELHDDSMSSQAARHTRAKERVVERMEERRKQRKPRAKDNVNNSNENPTSKYASTPQDESCIIL